MSTYTFGPFSLIPDRFALASNGASQQLTPRLLGVLQYLIRNRNRVVTKEELIAKIWNGSFIEEGIVARTVSTLRALLGDVAENPKYILTVSRVGYRFIHPVDIQSNELSQPAEKNDVAAGNWDCCFAGRQSEMDFLKERLAHCEQGAGSIVCVSGRAGIGKTALVEKLQREVEGRAMIARSRCAPGLSAAELYAPCIDAFTDLFNASDAGLRQKLKEVAPAWSSLAASAPGPQAETIVSGSDLPNSAARQFVAALAEVSRRQPVVLFIDDFHWADTASVQLVGFLSLRLVQLRLLLIIAARSTELLKTAHPFVQLRHELEVKGVCHQVSLNALSVEEVAEFVEAAAPAAFGATERLVRCLYRHSEGNPFLMISALRYFKSTGTLFEMDGKWCVETTLCDTVLTIPPNVEKLLFYTLAQLDTGDQHLLRVASLQGIEFDSATLSQVSGVPVTEVEERLRSLALVYELLRHLGNSELANGVQAQHYRFTHELFWKALQDSVVPSRKIAVCAKMADLGRVRESQM
jgi:predicted ATPase/DNA-binding winged helix-turn-helix (wHTH) protein